ncbi:MAG: hypothetical protein HY843_07095 [Bdellovibrio sp.]|nr:hypothetical protein [Bdellovibrio sp.]
MWRKIGKCGEVKWFYFAVPAIIIAGVLVVYLMHKPNQENIETTASFPVEQKVEAPVKVDDTRVIASDKAEEEPEKKNNKKIEHKALQDLAKTAQSRLETPQEPIACSYKEYKGSAPAKINISAKNWQNIMSLYHKTKSDLLSWLKKYEKTLPRVTYLVLQKQIKNTRIQRPPAQDEPDLSWRGIGVWSLGDHGEPLIRVGGGFVTLAEKSQDSARFELARLVAQSLLQPNMQYIWDDLLSCFNIKSKDYSAEATWAVASTIAALAVPARCVLPVFLDPLYSSCLKFNFRKSQQVAQRSNI